MDQMEAVDLVTGPKSGWQLGARERTRETTVNLVLADVCLVANEAELVPGDGDSLYDTRPVGVEATMQMRAGCVQDDDQPWLNSATENSLPLALGRSLVTAPLVGFGAERVWIGMAGIGGTVAFVGDTQTSQGAESYAAKIAEARTLWYTTVLTRDGSKPQLHLSPVNVPEMFRVGLLHRQDGNVITCWGDAVIMSPGYDMNGPNAFWTPPFTVTRSTVENTGQVFRVSGKQNLEAMTATMYFLVNLAPQTIVRVTASLT